MPSFSSQTAMGGQKPGATKALLVDYYTSYDVMPGDSFVGCGGVIRSA